VLAAPESSPLVGEIVRFSGHERGNPQTNRVRPWPGSLRTLARQAGRITYQASDGLLLSNLATGSEDSIERGAKSTVVFELVDINGNGHLDLVSTRPRVSCQSKWRPHE
jgi:hypothetical protein